MSKCEAVIFDMDGVLVDSEPFYFEVESKLFEELNLNISPKIHNTFVGMSMHKIWETIRQSYQLDYSIQDLIEIHLDRMIARFGEAENLLPTLGVRKIIGDLHRNGIQTAVATSTVRKLADIILEKIDLKREFSVIVCGDEIKNGKPAPDIFLQAKELLQIKPENCLVIEDSSNGIRAAKAAKMLSVGYQNPNSGKQNLVDANLIIENFRQLDIAKIMEIFPDGYL